MDIYLKHDFKMFFIDDIFGDDEYFSSYSQKKIEIREFRVYNFNRNKYAIHSSLFLGLKMV